MPMLSPLNAHQSQPKTLIHPHEQCSPAYAQWSRVMEYITLHWKASNQLKSLASKPAADPNLLRLLNSAVNKSQNDGETDQSFPLNGSKDILNSKLISDGTSIPWMHEDKVYSTGLQGLSEEMEDFYNYVAPIQEEKFMRNEIVNRLRQVATSLWPNAEVKVYGSFETGLYLPTSDIDVVIKCPDLEPLAALTLLEQSLVKHGDCDDVKVIRTSVPIVKFTDKNTATKVDVSINIEGALTSAEFIKEMMVTYPELKYLGFVLKQFLTSRGLLESFNGGISSYCLILLIISYLQLHPEDRPTNYGLQLIKFLELYGRHFNYLNCGIRVTDGGSYFRKGENSMGDKFSLLCVEDPFNADNDVGQSCFGAMKVREEFDRAFRELSDGVLPQYAHLQPPSTSLLARILNIAPEVVAYRRFVFERYRHHFHSPGVTLPYCLPQSGAARSFVTNHVQQPLQSVNHFGHHHPSNHQYQPAAYASGQGQQQLGFNQLPPSAAVPPLHLFQHQLPYQHLMATDGLQQSTFRYPHYAFPNYVIAQPLSVDGIYPMQSLQVQQPYVEDRSDSDSLSSQHSSQSSQISQGNGNNLVCSNKNSNESEQEPETSGANSSTLLPHEPSVTTTPLLVTMTTSSSVAVTSVIRTATVSSVDDRRGGRMDALCEITPTSKHSQNKSNNNNNNNHHHHQNNHNHHHHHDRYHQSNRSSGYQEDSSNRSQYIHRTNGTKHNGSNKNFSSTVFFSRSSPPLDSSSSRSSHQSRQGGNRSGANHRNQIVSASSASPATSSHPVNSSTIQKSKTTNVTSSPPSSTSVANASTQHHHHRNGPINCQQNSSHKATRKHNNYSSNNFSRNSFRNQKNSPSSLSSSSSSSCSPTYSPPGIAVSAVAR